MEEPLSPRGPKLGWGPPPPPPPLECTRRPHAYSHFLGRLSREDFPEKPGKGGVFKPISRDTGCFSEASREITKKGV